MTLFDTTEKGPRYHAGNGNKWTIPYASLDQLRIWADDPNCIEREQCAQMLNDKIAAEELRFQERQQALQSKRIDIPQNPFDPRVEISADARHIASRLVKNLWIIFGLLVAFAALYEALK